MLYAINRLQVPAGQTRFVLVTRATTFPEAMAVGNAIEHRGQGQTSKWRYVGMVESDSPMMESPSVQALTGIRDHDLLDLTGTDVRMMGVDAVPA